MTLEQEFKKETGLDAYILNDLRRHIAIDTYVEWLEEKCNIANVSQKRELLNALADKFNESTHTYVGQPMIEETLKAFNCG